jgi:hypothetical protein
MRWSKINFISNIIKNMKAVLPAHHEIVLMLCIHFINTIMFKMKIIVRPLVLYTDNLRGIIFCMWAV